MASWNQPYGELSSPESLKYSISRKRTASGSSGPQSNSKSTSPSSTLSSDHDAYFESHGEDRSASNMTSNSNSNNTPGLATPRWNPASLLNPRAFPQQQSMQNGFSNNITPQELAFQFDSPVGSYQTPSHSHPLSQYHSNGTNGGSGANGMNGSNGFATYANGGGMGSMLERMHNVAEREMLPQKRRKIHEEHPEDKRKAEYNGGGKGGVLGEYMRVKKEEGQKERQNGTHVAAVDLSAGLMIPALCYKELCTNTIQLMMRT
jgi:hypothetical protein